MLKVAWEPPTKVERDQLYQISDEVLGRPDIPLDVREEVFRISVLGLDWDIAGKVYEPRDPAQIPTGADGKKVGVFVLHGGGPDHRGMEPLALLLAGKLGYKVATMSYPGLFNLLAEDRDWPGDTIHPDGTARTPVWNVDRPITPDQYELIQDRSDPVKRAKWGTLFFLRAKEGTEFYDRMAAWPVAFEEAMREVCRRNFPVGEYSVYVHGHSTGGPFVHLLLQRHENVVGLLGMETSPFGFLFSRMVGMEWTHPFNYLIVFTWRELAKYAGAEAEPGAIKRLPWLMEDVLDDWEKKKRLPNMKAEYIVHYGATKQLGDAARATAKRLKLNAEETEALVKRYQSYARELSGPGTRPLPPILLGITSGSRDHTPERYDTIILPALAAMNPAPKVRLVKYAGGVHHYWEPEPDLPAGIAAAVARVWDDAINEGYFLQEASAGKATSAA